MGRHVVVLFALGALLAAGCSSEKKAERAGSPVKASDGFQSMELQYVPEGFPLGAPVSQGFALHLFETPGGGQKFGKLPPETGAKRYYDEFTIAGKSHLVVTEESRPPRIYFDENRNGDLTDDRGPFPGEKMDLLPNHYSIQILYERENLVVPYRMWLFGSNMGGVRFYPVCHWRGTLTIAGGQYPMVAFDGNADGDYSNDPLLIDLDGNGKAEESERLVPGGSITVGGKRVTLGSVSPSGLTVRLKW